MAANDNNKDIPEAAKRALAEANERMVLIPFVLATGKKMGLSVIFNL